MKDPATARRLYAGLLAVYGAVMVWLLLLQRSPAPTMQLNLVPFRTVCTQIADLCWGVDAVHTCVNLFGNVVMFVPLGLLPVLWQRQRRLGTYLLTAAALITAAELLQLVTRLGMADVDDLLCNLLGAWLGFRLRQRLGLHA